MAEIMIEGGTLHYEMYGQGPRVVLTSGGRSGMSELRPLAKRLAASTQVLIYDRRNCGASDVVLDGTTSEFEIWVDDLHSLMNSLRLSPAYVGGNSAGHTVSVQLAHRHPQAVKGLLLLEPGTSDPMIIQAVADKWYGQCAEVAQRRGMAAVIEDTYFGQHLALNATNRARLLAMEVPEFCAVIKKWQTYLEEGCLTPIIGVTEAEIRQLSMPAIIVPGVDAAHPQAAADTLHHLMPQSELVSLTKLFAGHKVEKGVNAATFFTFFRNIASMLEDFIAKVEALPLKRRC